MMTILVTDDEPSIRLGLSRFLSAQGWEVLQAETGARALEITERNHPDVTLLDLHLPDMNGIEVMREIKRLRPASAVIILTAWGSIQNAVEAMKLGADHYLTKPTSMDEVLLVVTKAVELQSLRREAEFYRSRDQNTLIGSSPLMNELRHLIHLVADREGTTVLIQGESGTGKELVAREIHRQSKELNRPFVDVNCAGLSSSLLESELFGHERGAFTDAKQQKRGLMELAEGGVLFLDEIGEMEISIQAKLLRVLQSRTFRRVGGNKDISVNVRIVAATNRNLRQMVQDGTFRDDLFYRLNVFPLTIAPLRERPGDVLLLAEYFLQSLTSPVNKKVDSLHESARELIAAYPWPGNVRELRNVIERAMILCQHGEIRPEHLPAEMAAPRRMRSPETLLDTLDGAERRHIEAVLVSQGGNISQTARVLGISRSTLQQKIRKFAQPQPV